MSRTVERLGLLVLVATLLGTGGYVFVYLYRWEWNRAILSGVLFVAAEIALVGWRLATRVSALDRRIDQLTADREDLRLTRLQETKPDPRVTIGWLSRPEQLNVFVPVLMGAGVLMSGLAWAVERLARATAAPVAERGLAAKLAPLSLPPGGFLTRDDDPLDLLRGPIGRAGR